MLRLHEGKWLVVDVHGSDDKVRAEPFAAFELDLDLSILWADFPIRASDPGAEYGEAVW